MIVSQLNDLFITILIMTLSGSALILLILALKPFIRHRLPKSVQYGLWLIILAALLVPVSKLIALPLAPLKIIIMPIQSAIEQSHAAVVKDENALPHTNVYKDSQPDAANASAEKAVFPLTAVLIITYMAIALAVLGYYIAAYIRFTKKVRRHRIRARMEELYEHVGLCGNTLPPRLYRSALATTPMLIGIFKPEIILPDREYTSAQMQSVLMHELTHLRRRDIVTKWLSVFACALHWFNPLVWRARCEIDRACELSCDEAVIRKLDHAGKRSYGETLISVAADTNAPGAVLSTTMCEEKEVLKERLNMIMKYQKRTWLTLVISTVVVVAAVCAVFVFGAGAAPFSVPSDNKADTLQSVLPSVTPDSSPIPVAIPSALPAVAPASKSEPDYLYQLRQNAVEVNTAKEFSDALDTANVIVVKNNITLSDDEYSLKNLSALIINQDVTLKITSLNFKADSRIINLGEIVVTEGGRMIYYGEPDKSNIGNISIRGVYSQIAYFTNSITANKIAHILSDDSMFNWIYFVGSSSTEDAVKCTIDRDVVIPEGKAIWINYESVLYVPEGVTLTNNGAIHYFNDPIIEGKIDGTGDVVYDG